jgi:hypothetical protein
VGYQCVLFGLKVGGGLGISGLFGFLCRSSVKSVLGTGLSCDSLFGQGLLLNDNSLEFVDLLEKNGLVLELVTLSEHVQGVVDVLVNLLGISQFLQHTTKDSLATHPQDLERKTGVGSTSALTNTFGSIKRTTKRK